MTKISQKLKEEIRLKIEKIAGNPAAYDQRKKLVIEDLRSIGDVYSFWIENPELRVSILKNKQVDTIRKIARKGVQAVHNSWYFLSQIGQYGKFLEAFNEDKLQRLNGLVVPNEDFKGRFRHKDVTLNIMIQTPQGTLSYTPTSWERVPKAVRDLFTAVRQEYEHNPLEAAIHMHLGLAAIQPFFEGNKRCSRLVQDRILYDAGMPPAIIPAGEGKFYLDLIRRTCPAYNDKNIEGQRQFYDYCASKVNNGLDTILNDLNGNSH